MFDDLPVKQIMLETFGSNDLVYDFNQATTYPSTDLLYCPVNFEYQGNPMGFVMSMSGGSYTIIVGEGVSPVNAEGLNLMLGGGTIQDLINMGGVVDENVFTITGTQGNYDVTFNPPAPTPSYTEKGLLEIDWSPLSQVGDTVETTGESDGNSIKLTLTDDNITAKVNNSNATLYYSLYDSQDTKIGDYELNSIELTSENSFTVTNEVCGDIYFAFEEDSETAKLVVGELDNYQIENVYVKF